MLELLADFLIKALGLLVPFVLRKFYKEEKIRENIKIRVLGEGDGVRFECGTSPNVSIWLLISNFSPFTIEIDRLLCQVTCNSVVADPVFLEKRTLGPAKETTINLTIGLLSGPADIVRQCRGRTDQVQLFIQAYMDCKVHNVELKRHLYVSNVRFVN